MQIMVKMERYLNIKTLKAYSYNIVKGYFIFDIGSKVVILAIHKVRSLDILIGKTRPVRVKYEVTT